MNLFKTITMNSNINNVNNLQTYPLIFKRNIQPIRIRPRINIENRLMSKRGRINLYLNKIPNKSARYVRDLWNTLVNMRWRWIMLTVALVNVIAYLIFANFFLLDAWISGDFDINKKDHKICIRGVNNFTTFFMLGIETITTTGYGYFHPTEYCRLVFVVLTFSTLVTIFIDGAFISVVYVKISQPTYKFSHKIFSKKAIINLRNGKLCLIFRINDRTGKHWINNGINLFLITENTSKEGEFFPNYIRELELLPYGTLFWPTEIVHEITSTSPLWDISAKDLMIKKFELLATITGSSVLTGQSSKSQTSYLSKEILWGFLFYPCLDHDSNKDFFVVNKKNFNRIIPHDTPLCSACYLDKIEKDMRKKKLSLNKVK